MMTDREWRLVENTFVRTARALAELARITEKDVGDLAETLIRDPGAAHQLRERSEQFLVQEGLDLPDLRDIREGTLVTLKSTCNVREWARGLTFKVSEVRPWSVVCWGQKGKEHMPYTATVDQIERIQPASVPAAEAAANANQG